MACIPDTAPRSRDLDCKQSCAAGHRHAFPRLSPQAEGKGMLNQLESPPCAVGAVARTSLQCALVRATKTALLWPMPAWVWRDVRYVF